MRGWGEGAAEVAGKTITSRVLTVAIPDVTLAAAQSQALLDAVAYGQAKGVTVLYVVMR